MISRTEFLSLVLPSLDAGEKYCAVGIKKVNEEDVVRQRFVDDIEGLSAVADALVGENFNAFFAVAKYGDPKEGRTANNAVALKSFYIDLDCGPGSGVATRTGRALAHCKRAKAHQSHGSALLERGADRTDQRIERAASRRLGDVCLFGDVLDQFVLVHYGPLVTR